jgi:hypothetical protein
MHSPTHTITPTQNKPPKTNYNKNPTTITKPKKQPKNSGGKAVRLIVEDGLEAYLPLADLGEYVFDFKYWGHWEGKIRCDFLVYVCVRVCCTWKGLSMREECLFLKVWFN